MGTRHGEGAVAGSEGFAPGEHFPVSGAYMGRMKVSGDMGKIFHF